MGSEYIEITMTPTRVCAIRKPWWRCHDHENKDRTKIAHECVCDSRRPDMHARALTFMRTETASAGLVALASGSDKHCRSRQGRGRKALALVAGW
jgi:hypothetical protein